MPCASWCGLLLCSKSFKVSSQGGYLLTYAGITDGLRAVDEFITSFPVIKGNPLGSMYDSGLKFAIRQTAVHAKRLIT